MIDRAHAYQSYLGINLSNVNFTYFHINTNKHKK